MRLPSEPAPPRHILRLQLRERRDGAGSGLRDYQMLTGEGLPEYDEEPNTIPSTMPMITGY